MRSNFAFSKKAKDGFGRNEGFQKIKSDGFRYELLAKNQKEVKNQNHAKNTHWKYNYRIPPR
jgi:hypothetical protein